MPKCIFCGRELNSEEDYIMRIPVIKFLYNYGDDCMCPDCYSTFEEYLTCGTSNAVTDREKKIRDFLDDPDFTIDREIFGEWVREKWGTVFNLNNGTTKDGEPAIPYHYPKEVHDKPYADDYGKYGYTPEEFFFARVEEEEEQAAAETYGFELELEMPSSCNDDNIEEYIFDGHMVLDDFSKDDKECIMFDLYSPKHDGSLRNGVEFTTVPMTRKFCTDVWLPQLKTAFDYLRKQGWTCHDGGRCGLHMHFSRTTLTPDQTVVLWYLINRFSSILKPISMRRNLDYCRFQDELAGYKSIKSYFQLAMYYSDNHNRYRALNIDDLGNPSTLEMRFMRGTLNHKSFVGKVYCMFALIDFAQKLDLEEVLQMTPQELWDMLKGYNKPLAEYCEYIKQRGEFTIYLD